MALTKLIPLILAAFLAASATPAPAHERWAWPLSPKPAVLRTFDPPEKPWLSGHRGVDLGANHDGGGAPEGARVTSPADGVVTFSGVVVDRPVLTIDHGDGLRSSFEPVSSELKPGDRVAKGDALGTVAADSGPRHCPGSCLHWGVRRGEDYINPVGLIEDLRPSVLLPLN